MPIASTIGLTLRSVWEGREYLVAHVLMVPHSIFSSACRKLQRADLHIQDLERASDDFKHACRYSVHVHMAGRGEPLYFEISFASEPSDELGLILADALHNLRAALDHAVWEMIGHDGGTRDRYLKLPTGSDQTSFEAACRGVKTPEQSTKDFLMALGIYPGGPGESLYWLCQLDNAEKHTIISPVIQAATVDRIEFIDLADQSRWVSENVVLLPGVDGRSYVKTDPGIGIDCNEHPRIRVEIFFGDVPGVSRQPILPALEQFRSAVADTLVGFLHLGLSRYPGLPAKMREALSGEGRRLCSTDGIATVRGS